MVDDAEDNVSQRKSKPSTCGTYHFHLDRVIEDNPGLLHFGSERGSPQWSLSGFYAAARLPMGLHRDGTLQPCEVFLWKVSPKDAWRSQGVAGQDHYLFMPATHGGLQMAELTVNGRTH